MCFSLGFVLSGLFYGAVGHGRSILASPVGNLAVVMLFNRGNDASVFRGVSHGELGASPNRTGAIECDYLGKWSASLFLCTLLLVLTFIYPGVLMVYGDGCGGFMHDLSWTVLL